MIQNFQNKSIIIVVCNDIILNGHHGVIQSPGYPDHVYDIRYCQWHLKATRGNRIRILFHYFRITEPYSLYSPLCHTNYIEVY